MFTDVYSSILWMMAFLVLAGIIYELSLPGIASFFKSKIEKKRIEKKEIKENHQNQLDKLCDPLYDPLEELLNKSNKQEIKNEINTTDHISSSSSDTISN